MRARVRFDDLCTKFFRKLHLCQLRLAESVLAIPRCFFILITTRRFLLSPAKRPTVVCSLKHVSPQLVPVIRHFSAITEFQLAKQAKHFNVRSLDRNIVLKGIRGIRSIIYGCAVCPNTRPQPCRGWSVLWRQLARPPSSSIEMTMMTPDANDDIMLEATSTTRNSDAVEYIVVFMS